MARSNSSTGVKAAIASEVPSVSKQTASKENPSTKEGPSSEEISKRAYEIFVARGGQDGSHDDDWHRAERELRLGHH